MGTETLREFRNRVNLDKPKFLDVYACPFLVFELGLPKGKKYSTDAKFKKTTDLKEGDLDKETFVAPVVKSGRNAFPQMVTLGRAPNNDIIVPHPSVSKFHAFFKQMEGRWELHDSGSMWGTKMGGKRLTEPLVLKGQEVVVFADSVQATFLLPSDFYDYMILLTR